MQLSDSKELFIRPIDEYTRDINPIGHYARDSAYYLHVMTGDPIEVCRQAAVALTKAKMVDPQITYLERNEHGDRVKLEGTLMGFIKDTLVKEESMAAPFTTYSHPKVRQSPYTPIILGNIKRRKVHKNLKFSAQQKGDEVTMNIEENNQQNRKTSNNSLSGAQNSGGTPLINKTAHSSLTSTCRITAGYGNANNERFVGGNRHYRRADTTLNNLVSLAANAKVDQIQATLDQFGLVIPTVDDVMAMVRRCSRRYWNSREYMDHIEFFVSRVGPIQRAAILYTGDFASLYLLNKGVIGTFITSLATKPTTIPANLDHDAIKDAIPEDFLNLAKMICREETRGLDGLKDIKGTPEYDTVFATAQHLTEELLRFRNLFQTFFVTDNLPASVAYVPEMVREVVVTGDTDSTIFSVENWVEWIVGELNFSDFAKSVSDVMIFLASQTIVDILAKMSANFGIAKEYLFMITMKNEYKFDVFIPTQMTKHYYAMRSAQEGRVFKQFDMEIKGVHMKSSAAPAHINDMAKQMMEDIVLDVHDRQEIDAGKYIKRVAEIEREVMKEIRAGMPEYFRRANIKSPTAYTKDETSSPYRFYTLWCEVFAEKYGSCPPPPFDGISLSLTTDRRAAMTDWLDGMADQELAQRFKNWMERNNKDCVGTIAISNEVISMLGQIPDEIMTVLDVRSMVHTVCGTFYHLLETLGIYSTHKGNGVPVLYSDHY